MFVSHYQSKVTIGGTCCIVFDLCKITEQDKRLKMEIYIIEEKGSFNTI